MEISTSILSITDNDAHIFYDLECAKTDYFHIDVMDGKFVEANTTEKMLESATILSHITTIGMDVHLMCEDIEQYIDEYIMFEPDTITFHVEALKNKEQALNIIEDLKNNNIKVGISLKPNTEVKEILEYLPLVHKVLVMTVEPGKGGQPLIESTIDKIKEIKEYIVKNDLETIIEADGGINDKNIDILKEAGVEIAVVGSFIINSENMTETIQKLK